MKSILTVATFLFALSALGTETPSQSCTNSLSDTVAGFKGTIAFKDLMAKAKAAFPENYGPAKETVKGNPQLVFKKTPSGSWQVTSEGKWVEIQIVDCAKNLVMINQRKVQLDFVGHTWQDNEARIRKAVASRLSERLPILFESPAWAGETLDVFAVGLTGVFGMAYDSYNCRRLNDLFITCGQIRVDCPAGKICDDQKKSYYLPVLEKLKNEMGDFQGSGAPIFRRFFAHGCAHSLEQTQTCISDVSASLGLKTSPSTTPAGRE